MYINTYPYKYIIYEDDTRDIYHCPARKLNIILHPGKAID